MNLDAARTCQTCESGDDVKLLKPERDGLSFKCTRCHRIWTVHFAAHVPAESRGMTLVLRRRPCKDCSRMMVGYSQQWYCSECSTRRTREANARSKVRQRGPLEDLPETEIDARFALALAEIRRSGVHRVEAGSFDYRDRYREP